MRSWARVRREYPALRKGVSLLKQIPRFGRRWLTRGPCYSVMANSIPKSGTHLLVQILEAFPGVRNHDSFIASKPPLRFRERSRRDLLRRIGWVAPGELVSAHLHYEEEYLEALLEKSCLVYLIYRDPRDVVVSEAHYLAHMNRWHRAHAYFSRALPDPESRISAAICGIPDGTVPYRFPDITARFAPYRGWLARSEVFCVRFESLRSDRSMEIVRRMAEFFLDRTGVDQDARELAHRAMANVDPSRSRTYRKGRAGGWREVFTERHRREMKRVAGDLLIELGYEEDLDW